MASTDPIITELPPNPLGRTSDQSAADVTRAPLTANAVQARADAVAQQEVYDRELEMREREEAAAANIDIELWRELPPAARAKAMKRRGARVNANPAPLQEFTLSSERIEGVMSRDDFEILSRQLIGKDTRAKHVLMCDPPIEVDIDGNGPKKYHPGKSQIQRDQMELKALQGFTTYPRYPFLPPPNKPCEMAGTALSAFSAEQCIYKGYTDKDVDTHMLYCHPEEYRIRAERLRREREEEQLRLLRLQVGALATA